MSQQKLKQPAPAPWAEENRAAIDPPEATKVVAAIKITAEEPGNTPAICRKCYVHPGVVDAYMDGSLLDFLRQNARQANKAASDKLSSDEASVRFSFVTSPPNLHHERGGGSWRDELRPPRQLPPPCV